MAVLRRVPFGGERRRYGAQAVRDGDGSSGAERAAALACRSLLGRSYPFMVGAVRALPPDAFPRPVADLVWKEIAVPLRVPLGEEPRVTGNPVPRPVAAHPTRSNLFSNGGKRASREHHCQLTHRALAARLHTLAVQLRSQRGDGDLQDGGERIEPACRSRWSQSGDNRRRHLRETVTRMRGRFLRSRKKAPAMQRDQHAPRRRSGRRRGYRRVKDVTRHSFAIWLGAAGVADEVIGRLLGHSARSLVRVATRRAGMATRRTGHTAVI
jgi:hypothetical protein